MAFDFRKALSKYVTHPEKFKDIVLFSDEKVVIIKDLFPKSKVHLLVMPRDPIITLKHPLEASKDDKFMEMMNKYISMARSLLIEQLNLQIDKSSQNYTNYLSRDDLIKVGVHSVPSMSNLHVHVMSNDFVGVKIKNKIHYNSFNTQFFVPWDELPLTDMQDPRYSSTAMKSLIKTTDLICIHCGKNLKNKFAQLLSHLKLEDSKLVNA